MWQFFCKPVHVIGMFLDEPIVCGKHNKLSWTSWQHTIDLKQEQVAFQTAHILITLKHEAHQQHTEPGTALTNSTPLCLLTQHVDRA